MLVCVLVLSGKTFGKTLETRVGRAPWLFRVLGTEILQGDDGECGKKRLSFGELDSGNGWTNFGSGG